MAGPVATEWKRPNLIATLCVASAFVPGAIAVVYILFGLDISHVLFNPITLAAFFWLGMTYLHYRQTRTRSAAWIFALFPVAFAEPFLLLCLWISVKYSTK
jgi:peptidoglycan/LPS O-acetylase OafA/YrhL